MRTTKDLLDETRTQLDEVNTETVSDTEILQALNRARRRADNIVARKYNDLYWDTVNVTTVAGQREYDIPAAAYGRRIEKIEILQADVAWEVRRISNHDRTYFITASQSQRPFYYTLIKNKIQLYPKPAAALTMAIHFQRRTEPLVLPQGRITTINTGSNYILVDAIGSSLSTDVSGFGSYVNLIDYNTGAIKGSLQIASLDTATNQIVFKTSGLTRSTVLGKTIGTSLPTDLAVDDFVSTITGTCVPEMDDAYTDYYIQYAVTEIRRKLGEATQEEWAQLKELERELERMWVGRESSNRVRKSNKHYRVTFGGNLRRLLS